MRGWFDPRIPKGVPENGDIGQFKSPHHLGKKRRFLEVRFDQSDIKLRADQFERQSGETGTGADVGQPTTLDWDGRRACLILYLT